jgi:hypothetical protein
MIFPTKQEVVWQSPINYDSSENDSSLCHSLIDKISHSHSNPLLNISMVFGRGTVKEVCFLFVLFEKIFFYFFR